jgi:arabinan endo-1,5-alpha-L-arabinosidase
MKNRYWSRLGALLSALALVGGCSDDDGGSNPPDAAQSDGTPQTPPDAAQPDGTPQTPPDAGDTPDAGLPTGPTTYTNPLKMQIAGGGIAENCPDPSIIRGQKSDDKYWYLFCTSNPLNDQDVNGDGEYNYHLLNVHRSLDLVNWTYVGDAFTEQPSWAQAPQGFWAPDIQYFNDQYYLYYSASDTNFVPHDPIYGIGHAAIGVATSDSPLGPWTHAPAPVIEPQAAPCCPFSDTEQRRRWVIDSNIIEDDQGQRYIYFGSYYGGIAVRRLSEDGLTSDPDSQIEVVSDERYEAAFVVKRDGFYYMFGSATNCCNGPLTGYSVFVGRSTSPLGPFLDRDDVPFGPAEGVSYPGPGRVGGTPVLSMNGNRWVGPGHNSVFTDAEGQDWTVYHAIDRTDPYRGSGPTEAFPEKRRVLIDPLDWIDGWPVVRGGYFASDTEQPGPAAQVGQGSDYELEVKPLDQPGAVIPELSDEFDGATLDTSKWSWVREPAATEYALESGALRWNTSQTDFYKDVNNAPLLSVPMPADKNFVVETKFTLDVPATGCCFNFTQAGLAVYKNDDAFLKLVHFSLWDTRQIEFAKEVEVASVPANYPTYGNTVAGPPGETTYLRIVGRVAGGAEQQFTAYTSLDGTAWRRAGTWTHELGTAARIGLVSMSRTPETPQVFVARFDYFRVSELME